MGMIATQVQDSIEDTLKRRIKKMTLMLNLVELVDDKFRKGKLNKLINNEVKNLNEMVVLSHNQRKITKKVIALNEEITIIEDEINGLLEKKG